MSWYARRRANARRYRFLAMRRRRALAARYANSNPFRMYSLNVPLFPGRRKRKRIFVGRRNTKAYYQRKTLQRWRNSMALPPIQLKFNSELTDTFSVPAQYDNYTAASTWSKVWYPDYVAIGDDNETRESDTLQFTKFKMRLQFKQVEDTENQYRLLVFQLFDQTAAGDADPDDILQDTSTDLEALVSPYLEKEDRTGAGRFRVWIDKHWTWNTASPKVTLHTKWISLPSHKVKYDSQTTSGARGTGRLVIALITTCPADDAQYSCGSYYRSYFLDQ